MEKIRKPQIESSLAYCIAVVYAAFTVAIFLLARLLGVDFMDFIPRYIFYLIIIESIETIVIKDLLRESDAAKYGFHYFGDRIIIWLTFVPFCSAVMIKNIIVWLCLTGVDTILVLIFAFGHIHALKRFWDDHQDDWKSVIRKEQRRRSRSQRSFKDKA